MSQNLLLRKATLADAVSITTIYLASRKAFVAFAPLAHSEESIHQWVREILIPTGQVTVAEENGVIVGMMALSKKESIGWIDQLYLSPAVVGRGIGTLLVTTAKSALGTPIRLRTFQENVGARRFYERHGFQVLELSDGSMNEENCPDILYEWRLKIYKALREEIEEEAAESDSDDDYVPFDPEDYIDNPVALARIKAHMTQKELAKRMGVTQAYISKVESQGKVIAKVLEQVSKALAVKK